METISLTMCQPREFHLPDGSTFEAHRIRAMEDEQPALHVITLFGVHYAPGVGPVSRVLVMHPKEPVDLQHHLADSVETLLATEPYEIA